MLMSSPGIRCENVSFSYPSCAPVLRNFNVEIPSGSLATIIGLNGTGKTTLLKTLAGLILPQQGNVYVGGWCTRKHWTEVRHVVGVSMYAERSFNFRLNGYQNAEFVAALAGYSRKTAQQMIDEIVMQHDAEVIFAPRFAELSLGQRRVFSLLMALLVSNGVILVDEPTATLDSRNKTVVHNLLKALAESGNTVVATTHDRELIALCDYKIELPETIK